jgi:outer membrane protein assembly factor BamB
MQVSKRRFAGAGCLAIVGVLVLAISPARAVIEAPMPLEAFVQKQAEFIFNAKVDKLDPEKPSVVLEAGEAIKGKFPINRLPINLTGDTYAKKNTHTPQLLKRLAPKLAVVVFAMKQDKQYIGLVYSNGTWFQITAPSDEDKPVWSFTHCEPYLRRTFKGTTEEMRQTVADSLAGKKAAPEYDAKEKPGLGPEIEEKPKEKDDKPAAGGGATGGPLFAVIPTVALGGIVSLLAMMFPAVFGGLTGQLKRWMVAISVASLNSTLLWLHGWLAPDWPGTWWATQTALWVTMTTITGLGVLWAWRRQMHDLSAGRDPKGLEPADRAAGPTGLSATVPSRYEQILLLILSGLGVALFGVCLLLGYPLLSLPWSFVIALWIGIWAATLYVVLVRWRSGRPGARLALSTEGILLGAMIPASLALGCSAAPMIASTGGASGGGSVHGEIVGRGAEFQNATPINFIPGVGGSFEAKPLIDGDRIYAAVAYPPTPFGQPGNLYCVERSTGKVLWDFNGTNKMRMKEVFSSPCLADGKIYIGEGFHNDSDCKLFCIDAATGKKLWEHATTSHTESSPCVVDGKVFCGAGGDGLLCLDATREGQEVWHYNGGHIDCPPLVVGKRVYCGSGVDRDIDGPQETAIFCLDAATGQEVWRVKTNLPCWGKPFVSGGQAFFPLGNGDVMNPVAAPSTPAGAILCVSAEDGKQVWRFDVGDGVLEGPAVDAGQVYFGSRDGHCYCVGRHDGLLRWKHQMESPVIAAPALAACSCCGVTNSIYAVARDGRACCLDPADGRPMWQRDFPSAQLHSPPVVTVEHTAQGDRRAVYFGAAILGNNQVMLYCLEDQWKQE